MRYSLFLITLFGLTLYTISPCVGIEPEKVESVVYRLQSFQGTEHQLVYSPPQVKEIYLIADSDNTFDPRQTLIYYWPLTREYVESWEKLDISVKGKLEIIRDSKVIKTLQSLKAPVDIVPNRRFFLSYEKFPYEFEALDIQIFLRYGSFVWLKGAPEQVLPQLVRGEGVIVSEVFSNRTGLTVGDAFQTQIETSKVALPI